MTIAPAPMPHDEQVLKTSPEQWVYYFGDGKADGKASMKNLLGGKGANLAEMSNLGLPVPPGFTLSTEICTYVYANEQQYPKTLVDDVKAAIEAVENAMSMSFGDENNPLLLSVRSGARVSMPGMMDTVLNLGLNDRTVEGLAKRSNDARFAYDSYRRFIQMYSNVVLGLELYEFEDIIDTFKRHNGLMLDTEIDADGWKEIIEEFKDIVKLNLGQEFPQEPNEQLWGGIGAVFKSWMAARAIVYRKINDIPEDWGTAVNVQAMVFGNMGDGCATGVAFTRNPSTGENAFYGEYLMNAQGEDVVAGIRTPQHLTLKGKEEHQSDLPAMEEVMPEVFKELDDVRLTLEKHYCDMQDIEFTIQKNKLYMLQTRSGKRTAQAALKIAVAMVDEGLITKEEAIDRLEASALDQLLHPTLDPEAEKNILTKGLPASPGAASGELVFNADLAEQKSQDGLKVILCRIETSPEDIHGMHAAAGVLTSRGGMTSHAAVVARGMGRPCVAGAGELNINYKENNLTANGVTLTSGDIVTIDGSSGEVMKGLVQTQQPELSDDFEKIMLWADSIRRMKIRTNAETPDDAKVAYDFGAEGIGLCRTEHMFFDADRILRVREMILAETVEERRKALSYIEPMQRQDFVDLFNIMEGLPVTIRLLDPPLHEFLPHRDEEIEEISKSLKLDPIKVKYRVDRLNESNPMLGHRGCRLGITFPEIYEMQARAIFGAVCEIYSGGNKMVIPEIMIPLVTTHKEFEILKKVIDDVADEYIKHEGHKINYTVGTMIELPRAALQADKIAQTAEFFSFGTNDLTQTTLGISRDDAGSFLPEYQNKLIYEQDPFVSIDQDGVGELVKIGADRGRKTRKNLKLGVCGEHGGDPKSIRFFETVGLDYVSCSPFRVPIARLAAAQATIRAKK